MLHGWMDVSASFQFLVDALRRDWRVIAPDWRGFGLSEWAKSDGYWFPDYFADLDRLLEHFQPDSPATLVGHSMGGNVAAMYAGIRPERVAKLVNLEGLGLTGTRAEKAPVRWVVGAESKAVEFLKLSPQDLAARKACFQRLTERVVPEAGHMLHHDQPERLAAMIEEFLG